MKITLFTSNQARHIGLAEKLAAVASQLFVVHECVTLFPGEVHDLYRKSPTMQGYFSNVIKAERAVFGGPRFVDSRSSRVDQLCLKMGDASKLTAEVLGPALEADVYVVFGASYIKGWLCDHLIEHRAVNLHMGASPYYRGNSCNFWAAHDGNHDYVGGTIHYLGKGLDSGPILLHAFPKAEPIEAFSLGMHAVRATHDALCSHLENDTLFAAEAVAQDKAKEIRYTRGADFTDSVAQSFMDNKASPADIERKLSRRDESLFLRPYSG